MAVELSAGYRQSAGFVLGVILVRVKAGGFWLALGKLLVFWGLAAAKWGTERAEKERESRKLGQNFNLSPHHPTGAATLLFGRRGGNIIKVQFPPAHPPAIRGQGAERV